MSKRLEELSKDLASGMSRRKAVWRFLSGAGAALLVARGAKADQGCGIDICVDSCRDHGLKGVDFLECLAASIRCPDGECALFHNGGKSVCVKVLG